MYLESLGSAADPIDPADSRAVMDSNHASVELRQQILGLLAHREAYGVEIAAAVAGSMKAAAGAAGAPSPEGSVYPALRWIERQGLASAHWVEVGEGARRRRYYHLTPKGMRAAARQTPPDRRRELRDGALATR